MHLPRKSVNIIGKAGENYAGVCYTNRLRAEQSRAEQSRAEQSRAEQSRAEQSRAEQTYVQNSGRRDNFVVGIVSAVCRKIIPSQIQYTKFSAVPRVQEVQ